MTMDRADRPLHSACMEIALAVLATWLLGNVVAVLAWALHKGAFPRTPAALPSVAVPAPRAAVDPAPVRADA